jgi:hypothetical protein
MQTCLLFKLQAIICMFTCSDLFELAAKTKANVSSPITQSRKYG